MENRESPDIELGQLMCKMASREAESFFQKSMMKHVQHFPEALNARGLASNVIDSVYAWHSAGEGRSLKGLPTDYLSLFKVLQTIFSAKFCSKFEKRCLEFDILVEREHASPVHLVNRSLASRLVISSAMISEHTAEYWVRLLCTAVASHCFRQAAAQFGDLIDPRTMRTRDVKAVLSGRTNKYDEKYTKRGSRFTQLTLQGPDLVTAWKSSHKTAGLERMAPRHDAMPSQSCNSPVYYGTAAHLNELQDDYIELVSLPFRGLSGQDPVYGVIPYHAHINAAPTTLAPFRSFLSSVFRAEVIDKMPSRNRDHTWKSGDEEYESVMLFQFRPRPPPSTGYSSYTIPENMRAAWRYVARTVVCLKTPPPLCWRMFSDIHGQPRGTDWPFIIYELEDAERVRALQPLTEASLWHSVWCGEGVCELNSSHRESFAIKYDIGTDRKEEGETRKLKGLLKRLL
ncbi:hypothetical protein LMH87_010386 [Akanthomyces muscarius]|uniref:Uncharacterized protein n=1 Tax=Akanthomyces muscarius TaxID=2231603 RepID=A0A9W8QD75_AKAMU|nr:hypothetical protein LMH87_010386 [Akanthomyces muscarius]KAJ4153920.1 hypothetical protein LMH87_010386 [Akanthomyces muscarius]